MKRKIVLVVLSVVAVSCGIAVAVLFPNGDGEIVSQASPSATISELASAPIFEKPVAEETHVSPDGKYLSFSVERVEVVAKPTHASENTTSSIK